MISRCDGSVPELGPCMSPAGIDGWPSACRMRSSELPLSITIAPEVGRLYQYELAGERFLFNDDGWRGRSFSDGAIPELGGVRFDVAEQASWAKTPWGRDWPPPPLLMGPRRLAASHRGALLSSDPDRDVMGLALSADVKIVPHSSLLEMRLSIKNLATEPRSWANWVIGQMAASAGGAVTYVPHSDDARFGRGFSVLQPTSEAVLAALPVDSSGAISKITYKPVETKLGFGGRGWIALRKEPGSDFLLVLQSSFDPKERYPDCDCPIQYYAAYKASYVELEAAGPLSLIAPGGVREDVFLLGALSLPGDVLKVNRAGAVCEALRLEGRRLRAGFGSFFAGRAIVWAVGVDGSSAMLASYDVSPLASMSIDVAVPVAVLHEAANYRVDIVDAAGVERGAVDNISL